jgi:hypothetical protein
LLHADEGPTEQREMTVTSDDTLYRVFRFVFFNKYMITAKLSSIQRREDESVFVVGGLFSGFHRSRMGDDDTMEEEDGGQAGFIKLDAAD